MRDEPLGPGRRILIAVVTAVMAVAGFASGRAAFAPSGAVVQPVQFNHQKHVGEVGMDCSACHQYFADRARSGLPDLALCAGCHQQPLTKSAEEAKLIALAAADAPPRFRKLFRLPDHAFYSHRRHVAIAALSCDTCHGAIAGTTSPPPRPLVRIDMKTCIDCHTRQSVQTDCTACHR